MQWCPKNASFCDLSSDISVRAIAAFDCRLQLFGISTEGNNLLQTSRETWVTQTSTYGIEQ